MPYLSLIASQDGIKILNEHIKMIGDALTTATVLAFPDLKEEAKPLTVYLMAHDGGYNVPPLQIYGVATWTEERSVQKEAWKDALRQEWWKLMFTAELQPHSSSFRLEESHVYVTLADGAWGLVRPRSLAADRER